MNSGNPVTRRTFLLSSIAGASALALPSLRAFGGRPNETLNVACIGVGGMGASDLASIASGDNVRIVALCDVDARNLAGAAKRHPGAQTFSDYRVLLEQHAAGIDAVVVSTPDHMHGPIAISAMQRGKHVYVQKPIAHNLDECRVMTKLAADKKLVTQMGTQIHAHTAYRTSVAVLRAGTIGRVREAHLWVGKSWAGPADGRPDNADEIPAHLDWDAWLGVAPARPYVEGRYHPANWRGWKDFGCGTLGDMGCHIFDPVFTALGIGAPNEVVSRGPQHYEETFAPDSDIQYRFPGTDHTTKSFTMRWTDGQKSRPASEKAQLPDGVNLPGAGSFLVGEKGVMVIPHWGMPRLYRNGAAFETSLEPVPSVHHYHEWTDACRGEGKTSTPFSYSGPLTEAVLVGTVAGRFKDEVLKWNSDQLTFEDHVGANALVRRSYRPGWSR